MDEERAHLPSKRHDHAEPAGPRLTSPGDTLLDVSTVEFGVERSSSDPLQEETDRAFFVKDTNTSTGTCYGWGVRPWAKPLGVRLHSGKYQAVSKSKAALAALR